MMLLLYIVIVVDVIVAISTEFAFSISLNQLCFSSAFLLSLCAYIMEQMVYVLTKLTKVLLIQRSISIYLEHCEQSGAIIMI